MRKTILAGGVAAAAVLTFPVAANANMQLSVLLDPMKISFADFEPHIASNTVVTQEGGNTLVFENVVGGDIKTHNASGKCTAVGGNQAKQYCTPFNEIGVNLGDGDDRYDGSGVSLPQKIVGGAGVDTLIGGSGNDEINARIVTGLTPELTADALIDCGPGIDKAVVGAEDVNIVNCETIERPGGTTVKPPSGGNGDGGGGGTTDATVLAAIKGQLKAAVQALKGLAKKQSVKAKVTSPGSGKLSLTVKNRKGKVLAKGSKSVAAGSATIKVTRTKLGKKTFKDKKSVKVDVVIGFKGSAAGSKNLTAKSKTKFKR